MIVLHSLEAESAEAVARSFARPTATEASVHYCVDADSIVQCVADEDVAWHAPGANHDGLGVALVAREAYGAAVLAQAAELVALKCVQYAIPAVWLYPSDLLADRRGITSRSNAALAFHRPDEAGADGRFPSEAFVNLVRRRLASRVRGNGHGDDTWSVPPGGRLKDPPPTLHAGDAGWRVRRLQRLLAARGERVELSGELDEQTLRAVVELQAAEGLQPDGVVGPATWHALVAGAARLARV